MKIISALGLFITLTFSGCGPHHVEQTPITVIKYKCVNWIQTVALCDSMEECNRICAEERKK